MCLCCILSLLLFYCVCMHIMLILSESTHRGSAHNMFKGYKGTAATTLLNHYKKGFKT